MGQHVTKSTPSFVPDGVRDPLDFAAGADEMLLDPITFQLLTDPLFVIDSGKTYNRTTLTRNKPDQLLLKDPVTGRKVEAVPNRDIRARVEELLTDKYKEVIQSGTPEEKARLASIVADDNTSSASNAGTAELLRHLEDAWAGLKLADDMLTLDRRYKDSVLRFTLLRGEWRLQRQLIHKQELRDAYLSPWSSNQRFSATLFNLFRQALDSTSVRDQFEDVVACMRHFELDLPSQFIDWRPAAKLLISFKEAACDLSQLSLKPARGLQRIRRVITDPRQQEMLRTLLLDQHLHKTLPADDEEILFRLFPLQKGDPSLCRQLHAVARLVQQPFCTNVINMVAAKKGPDTASWWVRQLHLHDLLRQEPQVYKTLEFVFSDTVDLALVRSASSADLAVLFLEQARQQCELNRLRLKVA